MSTNSGKAFDLKIFVRLMSFAKKYRLKFTIATLSTILLAVTAAADPYVLIYTINNFSESRDLSGLINNIIILLSLLFAQVILQFSFIFYANWVGQHIIRDIRVKTFKKILAFQMSFFDKNSIGKLVTRVVSDIEAIANFFTQGVFMIVSDILKMIVVIVLMFIINW